MISDFKPRFTETLPDVRDQLDKAVEVAIQKHRIACEELTEKQIAEVIKQALASGDIQKLVVATPPGTHSQGVIYIPFARQQELEFEIDRLTGLLDQNGIEWR